MVINILSLKYLNMKKSVYSKWHVKLVIVIACVVIVYLVIESFREGYKEGEKIKVGNGASPTSP